MLKKLILTSIIALLYSFPSVSYGAITPQLTEPTNNITITDSSPKLSWNYTGSCPSSGNCYLVEVAKSADFSSPEKSTYTNNLSYSPSLSTGTWFWRVKAKDENGEWSNFSEIKSFIINDQPATTPVPDSTPTPVPSIVPNNQGSLEKQLIILDPLKTPLNSTEILPVQINMSYFSPSTTFFLKPSFYQPGSTNYFGLTEVNNSWIKNSATATDQYKITTDSSGNWSGTINLKVDTEDSGFKGESSYLLKVGRYNESGSGLVWSNSVQLTINHTEQTKSNEEKKIESTPKPSPTSSVLAADEHNLSSELAEKESTSSLNIDYRITSLSSPKNEVEKEQQILISGNKQFNWWFISSGCLFLILSTIYIVNIRKKMYHS